MCATVRAPISAEVIRSSRNTHFSARWERGMPSRPAIMAQPTDRRQRRVGDTLAAHRAAAAAALGARIGGNAVEILAGEDPLGSGEKAMQPTPFVRQRRQQSVASIAAVEHRIARLIDRQGTPRPRSVAIASCACAAR